MLSSIDHDCFWRTRSEQALGEMGEVGDVRATEAPIDDSQRCHISLQCLPAANARTARKHDDAFERTGNCCHVELADLALPELGVLHLQAETAAEVDAPCYSSLGASNF